MRSRFKNSVCYFAFCERIQNLRELIKIKYPKLDKIYVENYIQKLSKCNPFKINFYDGGLLSTSMLESYNKEMKDWCTNNIPDLISKLLNENFSRIAEIFDGNGKSNNFIERLSKQLDESFKTMEIVKKAETHYVIIEDQYRFNVILLNDQDYYCSCNRENRNHFFNHDLNI